jgi:hypothetical protein
VKLGRAAGDLVEVIEGLTATDRLIVQGREGLTEGERIRITAEEPGLAAPTREPSAKPSRLPRLQENHKGKH